MHVRSHWSLSGRRALTVMELGLPLLWLGRERDGFQTCQHPYLQTYVVHMVFCPYDLVSSADNSLKWSSHPEELQSEALTEPHTLGVTRRTCWNTGTRNLLPRELYLQVPTQAPPRIFSLLPRINSSAFWAGNEFFAVFVVKF